MKRILKRSSTESCVPWAATGCASAVSGATGCASASRPGYMTVIVIVALLVTLAICGGMTKTLITLHHASHALDDRLQTELLAIAYLDYAQNKSSRDPAYPGETINITPQDWSQKNSGQVTITIDRDAAEIKVRAQSRDQDGQVSQQITVMKSLESSD
ncbi:MAG: hypothetical protein GC152_03650 [Alphaproteobacteria bacterium]|nr:hypothetical protein [Alphaproteobacteria bacterium]